MWIKNDTHPELACSTSTRTQTFNYIGLLMYVYFLCVLLREVPCLRLLVFRGKDSPWMGARGPRRANALPGTSHRTRWFVNIILSVNYAYLCQLYYITIILHPPLTTIFNLTTPTHCTYSHTRKVSEGILYRYEDAWARVFVLYAILQFLLFFLKFEFKDLA